jgi:hypothetical protein
MKMLVAPLCSAARNSSSKLIAKDALLMNKFILLLVKVEDLTIVYVKNLIGP